jgi:hypothetical protein
MLLMAKRLIIIALLLAVVIGGIALFFTRDQNPTKESVALVARLDTLQRLLDDGNKNSRSADLKSFTSESRILILGEQANLLAAFADVGIKKADKAAAAAEADTETFTLLKNAALSGRYDATYQNTLALKLDNTAGLVREVKNKTPNAKLKAALVKANDTISKLQDKLANIKL